MQCSSFLIQLPLETPNLGLLHPDYAGYFLSPKQYLDWYQSRLSAPSHPSLPSAPVVGILLYRKHVITKQPYIPQLIRHFEQAGLIPVLIFINGVEGHVAVRDWMTTDDEQAQRQQGINELPSLAAVAVKVDAIVSTIGFPLVGGPAGSMEAGRQVEVAKRILGAKNVPYVVAAPLLIQDIHSWTRQGVGGLQSVVLYALPELDGAIDPVPLGGLVGDDIYLVPERLQRLTGRLKQWIELRKKPPAARKIAIALYGLPPGYGVTGTAALLNVPQSLLKLLQALQAQGYSVGDLPTDAEELLRRVKQADEEADGEWTSMGVGEWGLGVDHWSFKDWETGELQSGVRTKNHGQIMVHARSLEHSLGYLQTHKIQQQWHGIPDRQRHSHLRRRVSPRRHPVWQCLDWRSATVGVVR